MQTYKKKDTPLNIITDSLTMAQRNLLKIKHTPEKLFDVTIQPIIFIIMFSFLFGGAISGSVSEYLPIVIPGILVQSLIQASASAGTELREDMNTGVFDRFNSLPISRISPLAGLLIADILRYAIASSIAIATGYIIGWKPEGGIFFVILATLLLIFVTWSISWIFATLGLIFKTTSAILGVSMIIIMIFSFVSNAYVPIETLPQALQIFASLNPVTHLINAFKSIAYEQTLNIDVAFSLLSSFIILVIFIPLTLKLYNRTIN